MHHKPCTTTMDYKHIKPIDLKVSALSLGCSRLGRSFYEDTRKKGNHILSNAFDLGINFFDTANAYCYGDSEKILGSFARDKRDKIIISTKGGFKLSRGAQIAQHIRPLFPILRPILGKQKQPKKLQKKKVEFKVQFLQQYIEGSLQRLKTDYIDVYKLHNPDKDALQSQEIPAFFTRLKEKGLIRFAGLSVAAFEDLKLCTYLDEIDVVQCPLNYANYKPEYDHLLTRLNEKNILVVARMPFERGLLTSTNRINTGKTRGYKSEQTKDLKTAFTKKYQVSEIQTALWFLKRLKTVHSILFSTFNLNHLKENIAVYHQEIPQDINWQDLTFFGPEDPQ